MKKLSLYIILILTANLLFGTEMVSVPGGKYLMGDKESGENTLPHIVEIGPFQIGRYEVTQKEWNEVMDSNPSYYVNDSYPVHNVSWYDAIEFCNKKSLKEGLTPVYQISKIEKDRNNQSTLDKKKWIVQANWQANGYRLPTEAEWEFAARGGAKSKNYRYSGSDILPQVGWYYNNSDFGPQAVGQKRANELGLYDMSGNTYEWCWDWYIENYYKWSPLKEPRGGTSGMYRVLRGGSWLRLAETCQVFFRRATHPHLKEFFIGFRLARGAKE